MSLSDAPGTDSNGFLPSYHFISDLFIYSVCRCMYLSFVVIHLYLHLHISVDIEIHIYLFIIFVCRYSHRIELENSLVFHHICFFSLPFLVNPEMY